MAAGVVGMALYGVTVAVEFLFAGLMRWLLGYVVAELVGLVMSVGFGAEVWAWVAALLPFVYSGVALVWPGRGMMWQRLEGARRPSVEEAEALADALGRVAGCTSEVVDGMECYVLDEEWPEAAVRGRAMMVSRGLVETDSLGGVVAHELGHMRSLDGRLTEALYRLELWGDPLRAGVEGWDSGGHGGEGGLLFGLFRWSVRLAGGGVGEWVCGPAWRAYWRRREYAADAYAGRLGQGEDLARHLREYELVVDRPQRRLLVNPAGHPPVALRIERLRKFAEAGVSK